MKRVVANSSPLIYLSKVKALHLLFSIYEEVLIPSGVYNEVVAKGLEKGYEDATVVKNAVEKGLIKVCDVPRGRVTRLLKIFPELDWGEGETLALASSLKLQHVLVDDILARRVASMMGLKPHGTIYIIIVAARRGIITSKEALKLLDELVERGFRISIEVYIRARKILKRF